MKNFLKKFGINVKYNCPQNNKTINVFLLIFELVYLLVSVVNLVIATEFTNFTIILNCLSFALLILLNYRNEHEHLEGDERYSLYFCLFLVEISIAALLALSLFIFGFELSRFKTSLFIMIMFTSVNKILNIVINLYKEE